MVIKTEPCVFSEIRVYPGHGIRFVRKDGQLLVLASSKCLSLYQMKRRPARLTWTQAWRRQNKKLNTDTVVKKRVRKTVRYERAIVGASLDELKRKRLARPTMSTARAAALKEVKERQKAAAAKGAKAVHEKAKKVAVHKDKGAAKKGRRVTDGMVAVDAPLVAYCVYLPPTATHDDFNAVLSWRTRQSTIIVFSASRAVADAVRALGDGAVVSALTSVVADGAAADASVLVREALVLSTASFYVLVSPGLVVGPGVEFVLSGVERASSSGVLPPSTAVFFTAPALGGAEDEFCVALSGVTAKSGLLPPLHVDTRGFDVALASVLATNLVATIDGTAVATVGRSDLPKWTYVGDNFAVIGVQNVSSSDRNAMFSRAIGFRVEHTPRGFRFVAASHGTAVSHSAATSMSGSAGSQSEALGSVSESSAVSSDARAGSGSEPVVSASGSRSGVSAEVPKEDVILTMFLAPYGASAGTQKYWIERNTILALKFMRRVEVVIFGKSPALVELGKELGVEVVTDFATNPFGTPILRSMFEHTEHHAKSRLVGYSNSDILFYDDLVESLEAILAAVDSSQITERVLVVGYRFNYGMPQAMDVHSAFVINAPEDVARFVKTALPDARRFQDDAEDFFLITPGTFNWPEIPDFVVGRPAYDNWLCDHAFHTGVSTVDVTRTVQPIHQTGSDGNKAGHRSNPDKFWNNERGQGHYDHGLISQSRWRTVRVKDGGIVVERQNVNL